MAREFNTDLISKSEAGFNTTLTDTWARALAYQLSTEGKDDYHIICNLFPILEIRRVLQTHEMPFPILNVLQGNQTLFYTMKILLLIKLIPMKWVHLIHP